MQSIRAGFIVLMFTLFAASALAAGPRFTPVQGNLVKKVDSFDYFVDYSGSMMLTHTQLRNEKLALVRKILEDLNALLPALDYQAGLYTFAPYGAMLRNSKWDRGAMSRSIGLIRANNDVFGRRTDLGDGFIAHAQSVSALRGRKALIIASDGETNSGLNPVIEARNLLRANPNLCLHIISLADSEQGQSMLNAIANLKGCSAMAKAGDLLTDDGAVRRFAEVVFYEEEAMEEVIVLRGVNFAFASDLLDATAQAILNEVAKVIKSKPAARVQLSGYTDHFGSDKYNLALSQLRADAVKAYLAGQGIDPGRMAAQGRGKSFSYDNSTEEGCYMNRRVEFVFVE